MVEARTKPERKRDAKPLSVQGSREDEHQETVLAETPTHRDELSGVNVPSGPKFGATGVEVGHVRLPGQSSAIQGR